MGFSTEQGRYTHGLVLVSSLGRSWVHSIDERLLLSGMALSLSTRPIVATHNGSRRGDLTHNSLTT